MAQASSRPIVREVEVTGTVTSPRTAVLSTPVAGLVAELTVEEGYRAAAGEALMKLDAELAELALERARALVRQRETERADAVRRRDEAIAVGTERGIAASDIATLRAEVEADEAALTAARVAAREQQALVDRHTLRAPFAGVISERSAELGEWVSPGDAVLQLVATQGLRFDFRVTQELFGALAPGAPVAVSLDAVPGRAMTGRIDAIVPVSDANARTFLVRVLAPDGDAPPMTPGMSARGRLTLNTGEAGVVVPRDAIIRFPDGRITVWVIDTRDALPIVRERGVRTGLEFGDVIEVLAGVDAGDTVVTRGNEALQEGQSVEVLSN
ncbi:MAG: efflux RND transporter periplasmic adaptor subunit [Pseudomonadota bacterium]